MTSSTETTVSRSSVRLAGAKLKPATVEMLTSTEVELSSGATGWCRLEFRVIGGVEPSETFDIGKALEVSTDNTKIFSGEIVAVGTEVDQSGWFIVVEAFDLAHKLGSDVQVKTYVKKSDEDVLKEIAMDCGLSPDIKGVSTTKHEHRFQHCTNQEMLEQICRLNGVEWRVGSDKKLYVDKKQAGAKITIKQGETLHRLTARYSAADHANKVTVRGWDPAAKKSIKGDDAKTNTAFRSTVGIGLPKLAGKVKSGREVTSVRTTVDSIADAKEVATGIARRMMATAFTGYGEADGDPKIMPGCTLKLEEVGKNWSGEYYITTARHVFGSQQYRTEFQFGPVEPTSLVDLFGTTRQGNADSGGPTSGMTIGIVTNNNDPDKLGRVKVMYPYLSDELESDWARVVSIGAGKERGISFIPEVDDEVLIGFEHGSIRRPFVLGGLWNGKDAVPDKANLVKSGKVVERVIVSRDGHKIRMSDGDGDDKKFVAIELADGSTSAHFSQTKIEIKNDGKPIELKNGQGSILIDKQGNITIDGAKITLKAKQDILLDGTNITTKAKAALKGEGLSVELKGTASGKFEASGMLELKGAMVKVN